MDAKLETLLNDLAMSKPAKFEIVQRIREIFKEVVPEVYEKVMYGGIMFGTSTSLFCGVFVYTNHVSVEFSDGSALDDPLKVLEGKGKLRRHIKLHSLDDINTKQLKNYISQAYKLSMSNSAD